MVLPCCILTFFRARRFRFRPSFWLVFPYTVCSDALDWLPEGRSKRRSKPGAIDKVVHARPPPF